MSNKERHNVNLHGADVTTRFVEIKTRAREWSWLLHSCTWALCSTFRNTLERKWTHKERKPWWKSTCGAFHATLEEQMCWRGIEFSKILTASYKIERHESLGRRNRNSRSISHWERIRSYHEWKKRELNHSYTTKTSISIIKKHNYANTRQSQGIKLSKQRESKGRNK